MPRACRGSGMERRPRAGSGAGAGAERARPGPARCRGAAAGLTWNRRCPFQWRRRNGHRSNRAARRHGQSSTRTSSGAAPQPIAGPCVAERRGYSQSQSGASLRGGANRGWGQDRARGGAKPIACGCVRLGAGLGAGLSQSQCGASRSGRVPGAAERQHGGPGALRRLPGGFPAALREPARLGAAARGQPGAGGAGKRPGRGSGGRGAPPGGGARPGPD